jgi:hypothetical protein
VIESELVAVFCTTNGKLHRRRACPALLSAMETWRARGSVISERLMRAPLPEDRLCRVCWRASDEDLDAENRAKGARDYSLDAYDPADVVEVPFSSEELDAIMQEARRRADERARADAPYGSERHELPGVFGEAAVLAWTGRTWRRLNGISGERAGRADVAVRLRVDGHQSWFDLEVKTPSTADYHAGGRLLSEEQFPRLFGDAVVWCLHSGPESRAIQIVGWSSMAEIRATAQPEVWLGRRNMRVQAALRRPGELEDWLVGRL